MHEEFFFLSAAPGFSCSLFAVERNAQEFDRAKRIIFKEQFQRKVEKHLLLLIIFSEVHLIEKLYVANCETDCLGRFFSSFFFISIYQFFRVSLMVKPLLYTEMNGIKTINILEYMHIWWGWTHNHNDNFRIECLYIHAFNTIHIYWSVRRFWWLNNTKRQ